MSMISRKKKYRLWDASSKLTWVQPSWNRTIHNALEGNNGLRNITSHVQIECSVDMCNRRGNEIDTYRRHRTITEHSRMKWNGMVRIFVEITNVSMECTSEQWIALMLVSERCMYIYIYHDC